MTAVPDRVTLSTIRSEKRIRRPVPRRRGLALVSVLWVLTLLGLIAANFTHTTRTEVILTRNLIESADAEALADAAVHRTILGLLETDPEKAWRVDGTIYGWLYGDGEIRIAVQDEGGKLDLNLGNDRLLVALFRSVGLSEPDAVAMVDRIADFRDPDDLHRAQGAEDPDYAEAGLPWDAKDAPFASLEELLQVLGMTPELYAKVRPALTLYAGRRPPFEQTAPPEIRVFYGVLGTIVDEQEDQQRSRVADQTGQVSREDLAAGPFMLESTDIAPTRSQAQVFTIRTEARLPDGLVFAREAIVRLNGSAQAPYELLGWRQVGEKLFPDGQETEQGNGGP